MGWYKRTRFVFDGFLNFSSRIKKNPIQESVFQREFHQYSNQPKGNFTDLNRVASSFLRRGHSLNSGPLNQGNYALQNGAKRFYYVDKRQVSHFRPRGYKKWLENPRHVFILVVVGAGFGVTLYFGNLETVPYTKRTHFVLLSKSMERQMGESQFNQIKGNFKGKVLPAIHPESVRVRLIAKDIIESLQKGLNEDREQVWSDIGYGSESVGTNQSSRDDVLKGLSNEPIAEGSWGKADEILDDKWVQQSRKKGQEKGAKAATSHLEGLSWEVVVVDEPVVNAFCLPGGKIVVFTGLLEHFKSDAEIATIIGHEVAHAVARHGAEGITKNLWFALLQLVLYQFVTPDIVNTMSALFLRLPFSRRMEMEADYIGLLLIASAGYDPRVAPTVYEKLGKVTGGDSALRDYLSTHPSGKKRAQLLAQAKVMEEALLIYREIRSGKGVEGFL